MKNKKAQISSSIDALTFGSIMFIILIIVIAVGAIVATNLKSGVNRDSIAIVNESDAVTLIWSNHTNMSLKQTFVEVSSVANCSGSNITTIDPSFYTVLSELGLIQADSNDTFTPRDGDAVCVNYTYADRNAAFNVSEAGEAGLLTFSDFFGVIAIIIVLVVIVGLLLGVILLFQRRA